MICFLQTHVRFYKISKHLYSCPPILFMKEVNNIFTVRPGATTAQRSGGNHMVADCNSGMQP